ncbi:hypothetical protein Pyn_32568 [Prunus yedoensis var. nudiflora]|uniref:Uncharacterized protein n=1 Tax=Prunus yedoensis var. nudiflora TaxID=2094558 RepID=A0A314Z626_PRUYE|nr:hypothetical protein Pyn_32568 [Prunus yedoensis var. nudiflora]
MSFLVKHSWTADEDETMTTRWEPNQRENRAVFLGEAGEGLVDWGFYEMEMAEDWKRKQAWREVDVTSSSYCLKKNLKVKRTMKIRERDVV